MVLTRIARAAIPDLAEHLHAAFRRCGGFVAHESLAEARAALDRVREPVQPLGGLPFAIVFEGPAWMQSLAASTGSTPLLMCSTTFRTVNRTQSIRNSLPRRPSLNPE